MTFNTTETYLCQTIKRKVRHTDKKHIQSLTIKQVL